MFGKTNGAALCAALLFGGVLALCAQAEPAYAQDRAESSTATRVSKLGATNPPSNSETIDQLRAPAESGDADAQVGLGFAYWIGKGVSQDNATAAEWFRKAALQGNPMGQAMLGEMYRLGRGVPRNYAMAADWFRKGAEQGEAIAQYGLGMMYQWGDGVPKNDATAF